jgi:ABC-2 type transport system permease protein
MSRITPVIKREFVEAVGSKSFLIGTILGPLLMIGIFVAQFMIIAKSGGGEHRVVVVDASGQGLGARVEQALENPPPRSTFVARPTFEASVEEVTEADRTTVSARLRSRVIDEELDGFLWLPVNVTSGGVAEYEGDDATNSGAMNDVRQAVQRAVQSVRLRTDGIDEGRLAAALAPVRFDAMKTAGGNPTAARLLAFAMAFAIYTLVMMYGQSIMQAVQEEKRDRIVELIVSSVRASDLLIGKVTAIGGAGVLQMLIWVAVAAVLLSNSASVAGLMGADPEMVQALSQQSILPDVTASVGVVFVLFFVGGFFLFSTLFAVIGSIVTNSQEAQQYVLTVMLPFILGLFIAMPAAENPSSTIAVAGSIIPFTSSMVMPTRVLMSNVSWAEIGLSLALLYLSALGTVWVAAKIYRVAIFATGKKPKLGELVAWLRAA